MGSSCGPLVYPGCGVQLHKLIDCIAEADPAARIHLVAHSHGGNVLLKTIDLVRLHVGCFSAHAIMMTSA